MLGTLYIVSAPSGAGKSSLISALLKDNPGYDVTMSVSHTTRAPRKSEQDGVHYHFVDVAHFKQLIAQDNFLEYAEVFGNFYGTSKPWIEQTLEKGVDIFLDIDWQGAKQIRSKMANSKSIFILPPSQEELERRLSARGQDAQEVIDNRMRHAKEEMSHYHEYDYVIINDDFDMALMDLKAIIRAERIKQYKFNRKYQDILSRLLA